MGSFGKRATLFCSSTFQKGNGNKERRQAWIRRLDFEVFSDAEVERFGRGLQVIDSIELDVGLEHSTTSLGKISLADLKGLKEFGSGI
jgi:hypothetical protein